MKYDAEYGDRCLRNIADLAKERNREIIAKKENFDGGCLILGNSYARNRILFCGLNPGGRGEGKQGFEPGPCTEVPYSYPFRVDPADRGKGNSYFRNCHSFCEQNEDVGRWFYENFISTFLSPWRSKDSNALRARNLQTDGLLFKIPEKSWAR
jgi:hypothetical protein